MAFADGPSLKSYLSDYPEILNSGQREHYGVCGIREALANIHFPLDRNAYVQARKRLAFEELLLFQMRLLELSAEDTHAGLIHREKNDLVQRVLAALPYKLTAAQQRVIAEIFADMESPRIMNRLLQGMWGLVKR